MQSYSEDLSDLFEDLKIICDLLEDKLMQAKALKLIMIADCSHKPRSWLDFYQQLHLLNPLSR
jgi:hypothetical protein